MTIVLSPALRHHAALKEISTRESARTAAAALALVPTVSSFLTAALYVSLLLLTAELVRCMHEFPRLLDRGGS